MTKLVWDNAGERVYESGVDRGVLYLPDGSAVVWNGITSVDEDLSDISVSEYYLDGVKYLNQRSVGDFSASVKAITYPDEFLQFDGYSEIDDGLFLGDQPVEDTFNLSYRTKIGTDTDADSGYKINVLYNLTAKPDNRSYSSLSASTAVIEFSWLVSGIPEPVEGYRPTVHVVIDTTKLREGWLPYFEELLYGNDLVDARLPSPSELISMYGDAISEPISEPL